MIVTCEECQTKFELDDDRVKETGSKVRCSKCEHIFKVFRPSVEPVEPEPVPPIEDQPLPESLAESEVPKEDVVSGEQESAPEVGRDEESLDFDFLEEGGAEGEAPSEESLDFDLGDLELGSAEGEGVSAEEATVSGEVPAEEPVDLGIEGLEEEQVSPEEVAVSEDEELSEESLDFGLEDLGVESEEETPSEEATASEEIPAEESVDLGIEGLEEEQVSPEEVAVSEDEELSEESLDFDLEDLGVESEEETPSEEAAVSEEVPAEEQVSPEEADDNINIELETAEEEVEKTEILPEDISPEELEAADEPLSLMSEEEGAEISEEKAEEITVDEEIGLELPDDAAMGTDTEDQELATDQEEEAPSLASEEEDFTLEDIEDISAEKVGGDEVESASEWEEGEEIASSEMKEMEEIPFDEESEQPEEEEAEPSEEEFAPATVKKKKRPSLALLILLIAISIAGGIYAAITFLEPLKSGFTIPYLNITIGGDKSGQADVGNLKIALLNVKGDFEDNKEAGPIFIIQGHVRNDYSKDRSLVRVKGFLHDKSGKMVKAKSVYCGNILTKTELEDLPVAEINKKLLLQSGTNQSNVKISPGKMVPFMVVFENLPGELGEFSVEVEGSAAG